MKNKNLFGEEDDGFDWEDHWKGMPEFVMKDQRPHRKIVVHFRNEEDVQKFAELMGQKISAKLPSIWFPYMPPRRYANKRYVDEP